MTIQLANQVKIPSLGFGTYKISDKEDSTGIILEAINAGYRHIDTASIYRNETYVGQAMELSRIDRDEFFITSKVWNSEQGYERTLKAFERSCRQLKTDYLDLYLIHWPQQEFMDTWKALEELYREKKVRVIGVSNFTIEHLKLLLQQAEIKPMINQVELHPSNSQPELRKFCTDEGIVVEAWSPLMRGRITEIPELIELSKKHKKTVAQIVIRWQLQSNIVTIPKSSTTSRIKENFDVLDFELSEDDLKQIEALNTDERIGMNPDDVYLGKIILG